MTSKIFNNKSKLILVLLMVSIMCLSLFAVACNKDDTSDDDVPSFSYTQTDDGLISNPTFSYGTLDTELKNFPKTSVTGWSRSKDSNANITQSSAKSGVINVSEDGYTELLNALYKDTYLRRYAERVYNITETDVKDAIKTAKGDDNYKPTSDEIREYYVENYIKQLFPNPTTHDGAEDRIVYMLNNYRTSTYLGIGTSQKITSSSEVTLNKGEYGKVTVYVKTQNIKETANDNYGANIRLISKFNGTEQAEYALTNIISNDSWTEYTIYVQADKYFDTSIKVALGLGYDLDGITQGTAYFDDVTFSHLTAEEFEDETKDLTFDEKSFTYNAKDKLITNAKELNGKTPLYTIDFAQYVETNANAYFNSADVKISDEETKSNTGKTGLPFASSSIDAKAYSFGTDEVVPFDGAVATEVEVKNASATLKFTSNDFVVDCEGYAYLSFYVKNNLNKFGSQSITFDVVEGENVSAAIASITEAKDEWQKVDIVVKNNFDKDAKNEDDTAKYSARTFSINVVIGPADVVTAKYAYEFATGSVIITSPIIAKGTTDSDSASDVENDLYSLLSSTAKASVALYAGYSSDYTDSSNTETYALTTAPSDIGAIIDNPASVKGYQGIVANHFYVKPDADDVERAIDTRKDGTTEGVAGLINTKYLSNYNIDGLESALAFTATDDEKAIQPIMIYNKTANHYGYVGESKTISASSYAEIEVTLRVVGTAKAYIYIVDVNDDSKGVMTFETADAKKNFELIVSASNMTDTGWVTVNFYIATGLNSKDFRVEMWNGGRDGKEETKSEGFVFIKDVTVTTSSAFTETTGLDDIYTESNPIGAEVLANSSKIEDAFAEVITHKRDLTATEIKFNNEYAADSTVTKVKYEENYIWAKNNTMIYAIYNTIDPVEIDPYRNIVDDEETSEGCTAETDPSTFWLSFSSILLGVALVVAIIMLFIKNIRRRRKANASDAKSHYKITSRTKAKKVAVKTTDENAEQPIEETDEEAISEEQEIEEVAEQVEETINEESEQQETDSYVYGDVEVFGDQKEENKD